MDRTRRVFIITAVVLVVVLFLGILPVVAWAQAGADFYIPLIIVWLICGVYMRAAYGGLRASYSRLLAIAGYGASVVLALYAPLQLASTSWGRWSSPFWLFRLTGTSGAELFSAFLVCIAGFLSFAALLLALPLRGAWRLLPIAAVVAMAVCAGSALSHQAMYAPLQGPSQLEAIITISFLASAALILLSLLTAKLLQLRTARTDTRSQLQQSDNSC